MREKWVKLSFIRVMKDKNEREMGETVLHKVDEGQNMRENEKIVLHKPDERQNSREYEKNCLS